jgi:hypothetical protein
VAITATNSGTFLVVVGDDYDVYYPGAGIYRLTLAQIPGAFFISDGEEGGALLTNVNNDGTINVGNLDMWSFWADKGNGMVAQITSLTNINGYFTPQIRLYGPDGTLLNTAVNATMATISRTATNSGTFTILAGDGYDVYYPGAGSYQLTIAGITGPPQYTSVRHVGSQFIMNGINGPTNEQYVVITSTNITTPVELWTPITTNFFGSLGQFLSTNNVIPGAQSQFFRLSFQ